ncbi:MAG TPA: YDG domain-containing protein, partial [Pyrinomonadaceae bacterium]|nr:YDG domain-containing protein [Pyrinomonadaceae bacterium]
APGETAHVSGTGFAPGELVRVMIHEDPHTPFERGFDATTDAAGNFAGTYAVRDHDLRMTFVVGVRGLTSGRTAQTTFTDASPGTLGNFATLGLSGATVSVAPSNLATNISFSNLTRGTGLTAASLTNAFNSSGWTTSATPDANDYYEFTITPNAGFAFSTSELRIGLQRSSTGPPNLVLRSSLDSYASNIGPVIAPPTGSTATTTIDLSPVAGLQNAMAPVTLRFYGYGASSGAGTLRIERVTSVPMVGLEVDGNVAQSCVSPAITAHPSDLNVLYGMFATFNAAADGTGLNVVWEVSADDGATWTNTGVTTATLSFPVAGVALDGNLYRAVFSNSCGTSTSNSARLSVGRKPLTPIVTADDKTYDGAASATVSSCTLDAVEPGDIVNCSVAGPITFSDPNAGAGKMVTAENIGLAGVASDNYALTSTTATTTADIDPAPTETDLDCLPGTFVYAASSITPCSATVTGANLATSTDVVYMNNLNAGIATANASYPGDPNHTGSTADESEFSITKMPAAWTTNDANRFFGSTEPSPVTTGFGSGFFAADGVSATYAREGGSGAGLYHITATLSSTALGNYEITNTGATFTIIPDPTSITGDANVDGVNGDCTNNTYTSTLKDTITNDGIVGVAMRMTIGSQQATALTDSNGVATFTLTLAQSPGVVQQSFQLDQSWTDPNRVSPLATSPRNFTVSGDPDVEPGNNADSMYTGSLFFWTTSATSNTATLTLSATIKDSSGSCSNGDITRARVSFLVSSNGGSTFIAVPNAQNLPVGLVDPNEPSVGTASATSQYNIGTAQSATLIVRVVVGGFYNFSSSEYDTPITIGKSGSANSLMGGGKLKNDGSPFFASGYIGMNSISSTFGTHVQYNKKGTNPQGDVTLYVRSCNFPNGSHDVACVSADPSTHHVYFIKSNSISELALIGGSASFSSKANVSEVMNDDARVTLDGGNTMQLLFTPFGLTLPSNNAGNPIGAVCTSAGGCASIIVYRSSGIGGGVWYSSSWGQPAGKPLQTWLKSVSNGTVAVQ